MTRPRLVAGLMAGALLIASSIAHSFLGWKQLSSELAQTTASQDLVGGLAIGWSFGGLAMLVFGLIVLTEFILAARGVPGALRGSFMIGVAYVPFGVVSMIMTGMNPFFLVFIVPGLMLAAAAWPWSRTEGAE